MLNKTLILNPPFAIRFNLTFPLKAAWLLIGVLIISLFISCIYQLNLYTKEFYLIQKEEKKLNQLTKESKSLEIRHSGSNSLTNMGGYLQSQVFEKVGKVEYIQLLGGTVLAK